MKVGFFEEHWDREVGDSDADSRLAPDGGVAFGRGWVISWQRGALGRGTQRMLPNGAFVEDVLDALISRLEYFQQSDFACAHNAAALVNLYAASRSLADRTKEREDRGVEGTHEI